MTGALSRVFNALGPVILLPLMVRAWGTELYGEWLILTAVPAAIMMAPDFGLVAAVVNRIAFLSAQGRDQEGIRLYRSSGFILTVLSGCYIFLGPVAAYWVNWSVVGLSTITQSSAAAIVGWSCLQIFFVQQAGLVAAVYRTVRRNPRVGLIDSLGAAGTIGAGVAVVLSGGGPVQCAVAFAAARGILLLVLLVDASRIRPDYAFSFEGVSWRIVRPQFTPGLGHAGSRLARLIQDQGSLIILGALLGPTAVATFQALRVLSNSIKSIFTLLGGSVRIELAALLGESRPTMVQRLLVRNFQLGAIASLGAIVLVLFAGDRIHHWWLGGRVEYIPMLMHLLLLSLLPFVYGQTFGLFLSASNRIHRAVLPLVGAAILSSACLAIASAVIGVTGAGVATICWELASATILSKVALSEKTLTATYFRECLNIHSLMGDLKILSSAALSRLGRSAARA